MNIDSLLEKAIDIREKSYSPYSNFPVGAALLTVTGKVFTGCNIENAAFPVSCCAERVAIFSAIAAGETEFKEIVVVADTNGPVSPCGSCRQVMSEFFDAETNIHLANLKNDIKTISMEELLPFSFKPKDLMD